MAELIWHRVAGVEELPEGRVRTVVAGHKSVALTHYDGQYGALDNRCPHQGGPLGEGSIENGLLRCPWHGFDYCPLTGRPPSEFADDVTTYAVEVRDDGVYVGVEAAAEHARTVSDVMAETMVAWGVKHVFGMVGHSNLGLADAIRRRVEAGELEYIGIRHEGAAAFAASAYGKLTGRPAACLTIAGPGATNLMTGLWDAKVDRAPVLALTGGHRRVAHARRAVLAALPLDGVATLLSDASHFEGSLTVARGDGITRLADDPFARIFPARLLHVRAGVIGRLPAPAGPVIERYGSAQPWPQDRFAAAR